MDTSNMIRKELDDLIRLTRIKVFFATWQEALLRLGPWLLFAVGTGITIYRAIGWHSSSFSWLSGMTAVALAALLPTVSAIRNQPQRRKIIALLAARSGEYGGLLLTMEKDAQGVWTKDMILPESPEVRCRYGVRIWVLLTSLVFLIASCLVPTVPVRRTAQHMDVSNDVKQAEEQVNLLETNELITPSEKIDFQEQLKNLSATANGEDPVRTWEALDHLQRGLADKARMAEENALKSMQDLALLGQAAQMMATATYTADQTRFPEARKGFEGMLDQLCKGNPALERILREGSSGKPMSAGDLKRMAETCRMSQQELSKMLERMKQCGMLGSSSCSRPSAEKGNREGLSELKDFLEGLNCQGAAELRALCNKPGDGGTSRGRGDALLTTDEREVSHHGVYKDISLPPPSLSSLQDSQVLATGYAAPEEGKEMATMPGRLISVKSSGSDLERVEIQPRHRQTVNRYFDHRRDKTDNSQFNHHDNMGSK